MQATVLLCLLFSLVIALLNAPSFAPLSNRSETINVAGRYSLPPLRPGSRQPNAVWPSSLYSDGFIVLGGYGVGEIDTGLLNDLWTYNTTTGEWNWLGPPDSSTDICMPSQYGQLGEIRAGLYPGGRVFSAFWSVNSNHYLYGGMASLDTYADMSDMWVLYEPTGMWGWIAGSQTPNTPLNVTAPGGAFAFANSPGGRHLAAFWQFDSDPSILYLMGGGYKSESNSILVVMADMWAFNTSCNNWAWVIGTTLCNQNGNYSGAAAPGGRRGHVAWPAPNSTAVYIFGGHGMDNSTTTMVFLNDLWMFTDGTWTFVAGCQLADSTCCTGASSFPPCRWGAAVVPSPTPTGMLLLWGDYNYTIDFGELWVINVTTGDARILCDANMPASRSSGMVVQTANGNVYLLDGNSWTADSHFFADVYQYSPCIQGCGECSVSSVQVVGECMSCAIQDGYIESVNDTLCVTVCEDDQYNMSSGCYDCTPGCASCRGPGLSISPDACLICNVSAQFYLNFAETACVPTCPWGRSKSGHCTVSQTLVVVVIVALFIVVLLSIVLVIVIRSHSERTKSGSVAPLLSDRQRFEQSLREQFLDRAKLSQELTAIRAGLRASELGFEDFIFADLESADLSRPAPSEGTSLLLFETGRENRYSVPTTFGNNLTTFREGQAVYVKALFKPRNHITTLTERNVVIKIIPARDGEEDSLSRCIDQHPAVSRIRPDRLMASGYFTGRVTMDAESPTMLGLSLGIHHCYVYHSFSVTLEQFLLRFERDSDRAVQFIARACVSVCSGLAECVSYNVLHRALHEQFSIVVLDGYNPLELDGARVVVTNWSNSTQIPVVPTPGDARDKRHDIVAFGHRLDHILHQPSFDRNTMAQQLRLMTRHMTSTARDEVSAEECRQYFSAVTYLPPSWVEDMPFEEFRAFSQIQINRSLQQKNVHEVEFLLSLVDEVDLVNLRLLVRRLRS